MKFPSFTHHAPTEVGEAVALLAELGDEAKVLAGGQSLLPLLSFRLARPEHLVDVNRVVSLRGIRGNGTLTMGSVVRHHAAESSDVVRSAAPLVAHALGYVGHQAIRNRGTIGGSVAHADPAAELPTVLCALDAEVEATSIRGSRTIAAVDLFEGFLTTTLGPDELLTTISVPLAAPGTGWGFQEFSRRDGDFAVVATAATLTIDGDGRVARATVALAGVDGVPVRAGHAEALMVGERASDELWSTAAAHVAGALEPPTDIHGSAAYRRHLARHLVHQALTDAHGRAVSDRT